MWWCAGAAGSESTDLVPGAADKPYSVDVFVCSRALFPFVPESEALRCLNLKKKMQTLRIKFYELFGSHHYCESSFLIRVI